MSSTTAKEFYEEFGKQLEGSEVFKKATPATVKKVIIALQNTIAQKLLVDDTVKIPGIAAFTNKTRKARTGRNPRTGESVNIPEKKVITVKNKLQAIAREKD